MCRSLESARAAASPLPLPCRARTNTRRCWRPRESHRAGPGWTTASRYGAIAATSSARASSSRSPSSASSPSSWCDAYRLQSSPTLLRLPARPRPGDSPSVPTSKSHRSQGRTSHVNQVNNLNLRRESLATAAERSNAYRNARCSVTWLVHTGAHSGSLELEETVRDLQRITGVAANKEWRLRRERRGQVRRPPVPTGTIAAERLSTSPSRPATALSEPDSPERSGNHCFEPSTRGTGARSPCRTVPTPQGYSPWRSSCPRSRRTSTNANAT